MSRSTITALVVIIVLVIAGLWLANSKKSSAPAKPATKSSSPSPKPSASPKAAAATIDYTTGSFSPKEVTLKAGQSITFDNKSSEGIQVESDPHPAHTSDVELNVGPIAAGQSKTVTLHKTGTFGIHNHLEPTEKATVTVQ